MQTHPALPSMGRWRLRPSCSTIGRRPLVNRGVLLANESTNGSADPGCHVLPGAEADSAEARRCRAPGDERHLGHLPQEQARSRQQERTPGAPAHVGQRSPLQVWLQAVPALQVPFRLRRGLNKGGHHGRKSVSVTGASEWCATQSSDYHGVRG